jgi:hypothetical protein
MTVFCRTTGIAENYTIFVLKILLFVSCMGIARCRRQPVFFFHFPRADSRLHAADTAGSFAPKEKLHCSIERSSRIS